MKIRQTIHEVSNTINTSQLDATNLLLFKTFSLPIWVAVAMSISFGFVTQSVRAENTGTEDVHRGYRYIPFIGVENTSGSASQGMKESSTAPVKESSGQSLQIDPVSKPTDGKGVFPTFAQADINGDHYLTKYELKNFPYMLQVFDKVDAGKDGKLEQHEYQNLEMETKREGEIR